MALEIHTFTLGSLANNTYVLVDSATLLAVIVDPAFGSRHVAKAMDKAGWKPFQIWLTHAHFDHTAGITEINNLSQSALPVGIHPHDLELYKKGGGAELFGIPAPDLPEPTIFFDHDQQLSIGAEHVEVRHTPGHSAGHVVFYLPQNNIALVGDLIFKNGVGRTDLPGGSMTKLLNSIYKNILTLPPETRLLSGHGAETTVADEAENNPYVM